MNLQLIAYPQGTIEPLSYPTGEVILDLYKDEPIPLVLNVDDFTNVAEKASSYSKSFEIPGTKTNNLFFNHIYDITSDSNFNPHLKTKIIVKEDSLDIFSGYLQLNEIINKGEEISYEITLFSEATNLKDILSEKVFRDLDLSELNHTYNKVNIKNSWTGVLDLDSALPSDSFAGSGTTTDVLKYPLVSWNGINIGNTFFYMDRADNFRAFVNALYLTQNIFRDAGFNFNSTFLNSTDFNKLYLDFNPGTPYGVNTVISDNAQGTYNTTLSNIDFTTAVTTTPPLSDYYDLSTDVFTATTDGLVTIGLNLDMLSGGNMRLELHCSNTSNSFYNGTFPYTLVNGSTMDWGGAFALMLDAGDTIEVKLKANSGTCQINSSGNNALYFEVYSATNINLNDTLLGYKGDVNQWDFFKGIIDMFNLLIMVDDNNPNILNVIPYKDWVDTGNLIDWTDKIDDTDIKYTPIDGLARKISFKLSEDADDWITFNHSNPSHWRYGYDFNSNIEIADKDIEEINVKAFSDTYVKYLNDDLIVPQIVNQSIDDTWENNLRLLYDNGVVTLPNTTYSENNNLPDEFSNESDYLLFSAVNQFPITSTASSYRFNSIKEQYSSTPILNSLYNVYWDKYIDELYHKDTRIAEMKILLTAKDLSEFKFNDIILIKNKKFRVKKIEYKSGAMSKVELITIKDL